MLLFDQRTGKFKAFGYNSDRQKNPDTRKLDDKLATVLYKDKSGILWVGANLGGLNRFNAKDSSFSSFFYR